MPQATAQRNPKIEYTAGMGTVVASARRSRNVLLAIWLSVSASALALATDPAWAVPLPDNSHHVDLLQADSGVVATYTELHRSWVALYSAGTGSLRWRRYLPDVLLVGHPVACGDAVCVPTASAGVYVLGVRNGEVRAHLETGADGYASVVACSPTRILVVDNRSDWTSRFTAFDTTSLEPAWRQSLLRSHVWEAHVLGDAFELVLSQPYDPGDPNRERHYERVRLRIDDGEVASRNPIRAPASYDMVPETLPGPVRRWLTELLRRKGGVLLARTQLLQIGKLWFVGNLEDKTAPAKVYAVRDTGQVVWQRRVPGLAAILLHDRELIAASYGAGRETRRLVALRADTGQPLWDAKLECPTESTVTARPRQAD